MEDFVKVLQKVDSLFLIDVYSAGEKVIPGVSSYRLYELIKQDNTIDVVYVESKEKCFEIIPNYLKDNDVLVMQGAGSVGAMAQEFSSFLNIKAI
jgi:UDP-N-acetylmuramate--alanine ligase